MYNQCANEVLRYAVKSHRGLLADDDVPKDIYDSSPLPAPPRPGDIDVIVAGFPWCVSWVVLPAPTAPADAQGDHHLATISQPHSQLNMFQKANDVKSNLILNLLSWVDFLEPPYCVFENVRGFLSYNLRAVQLDEHRTAGGISMGGLKFLVQAMLAMKCVLFLLSIPLPRPQTLAEHSSHRPPQLPSPLLPAAGRALRHTADTCALLPPRGAARTPPPRGAAADARFPADAPPRGPLPERGHRARSACRGGHCALPLRVDRRRHQRSAAF